MDFEASEFWDFSISLYRRDGVADACLALQDRHNLDINFFFFCIWTAQQGLSTDAPTVELWHSKISDWHNNVVRHLRFLRRALKNNSMGSEMELAQSFRARLQKLEIDAEHIEQITLTKLVSDTPAPDASAGRQTRKQNAHHHVDLYLAEIGASAGEQDKAAFDMIIEKAFTDDIGAVV